MTHQEQQETIRAVGSNLLEFFKKAEPLFQAHYQKNPDERLRIQYYSWSVAGKLTIDCAQLYNYGGSIGILALCRSAFAAVARWKQLVENPNDSSLYAKWTADETAGEAHLVSSLLDEPYARNNSLYSHFSWVTHGTGGAVHFMVDPDPKFFYDITSTCLLMFIQKNIELFERFFPDPASNQHLKNALLHLVALLSATET